jgi:hypothetical protein
MTAVSERIVEEAVGAYLEAVPSLVERTTTVTLKIASLRA